MLQTKYSAQLLQRTAKLSVNH